jgi:hypothetical protein
MDSAPQPTNDHERTIVAAIETKLLVPDSAYEAIVAEVVVSLPFAMSIADAQFLFNYARWRVALPTKKQPARGIMSEDRKRSA